MKKTLITLEIVWDDDDGGCSSPEEWSWRTLLGLDSNESVKVTAVQTVEAMF